MFTLNQRVEANSNAQGRWYPGIIQVVQPDGKYTVSYNPPGPPTFPFGEPNIPAGYIRPIFRVGDEVEANSRAQGPFYPGRIQNIDRNGNYDIQYYTPLPPIGQRENGIPAGYIRPSQNQAARRMEPVRDDAARRRQMEEDAMLAQRLQAEEVEDVQADDIHDNDDNFNMEEFLRENPDARAPEVRPPGEPLITMETAIVPSVTFTKLVRDFTIYQRADLVNILGEQEARDLDRNVMACVEVHRELKKIVYIEEGLNDLRLICGGSFPRRIDTRRLINDFGEQLRIGINFELNTSRLISREALEFAIQHLLYNRDEGLSGIIGDFNYNQNRDLPANQFLFGIVRYLQTLLTPRFRRSGQILHCAYVMEYLQIAVSGYRHTINTLYTSRGRPLPGEMFGSSCQPGNADRVTLALATSIKNGFDRIYADPTLNVSPPPRPLSQQIRGPPPPPQQQLVFPVYNSNMGSSNNAYQVKLNALWDRYRRVRRPNKSIEDFKIFLAECATQGTDELCNGGNDFLREMSIAMYAPGSAYMDDNGPTFVAEFLDDFDFNTVVTDLGGKRRKNNTKKGFGKRRKNTKKGFGRKYTKRRYIKKNKHSKSKRK
jgi:hypothetical protein